MGPFPHDALPAAISPENPMGTDGFEFVEFAHPDPAELSRVLELMGFTAVARHRSKAVTLYRQGDVNYVVNAEPDSFAAAFAAEHGPCACAMAFRVTDAKHAYERALSLGAEPYTTAVGPNELAIPAVRGIGGSLLYFVDRYGNKGSIWDVDFVWTGERDPHPEQAGLYYLDHLTHNVHRGRMDHWAGWYEKLFNFKEIRFFNIEGKLTGLISRALTSPCGKIRIPINESLDDKSQIEEYLREYKGEGIQHIACGSRDIYQTVEALRANGLPFMPSPPATYYEKVDGRVPGHGEPVDRMKRAGILIDGEGAVAVGEKEGRMSRVLLQIFSGTVLGPIFFEFIQRKGDDGFGEGNFRALFESIEEDQIRRGVIGEKAA
ncbi:4-hydroxyphenylpyruvate dioxygenase [Phreatobacter aquaticus]|uniref:4-hydroxyphenylpyruvate dioxygenase n=1 Tax=Phreatobacter aquaticus TaxID=2570229 RepID=A0A4D7Q987_9HYPH|nr:4-hydroxyphenylpyruvate dioxygenase [Phreatobacter aquaticus]QCK84700.1 4-hydroxyphenylpyruvate dioxygenase [Phreatobacter aquaticus]